MAKLPQFLTFLLLLCPLSACDTGSLDDGGGGSDAGGGGGDPDDPSMEERPVNFVCSVNYTLTGTFEPAVEPGPDPDCDPTGTWTVNLVEVSNDCSAPLNVQAQYIYEIAGNPDDGWTYSYMGVPDPPDASFGHQGSGSNCTGSFLHLYDDAKDILLLRPHIAEQAPTIGGSGSLERYSVSQSGQ